MYNKYIREGITDKKKKKDPHSEDTVNPYV